MAWKPEERSRKCPRCKADFMSACRTVLYCAACREQVRREKTGEWHRKQRAARDSSRPRPPSAESGSVRWESLDSGAEFLHEHGARAGGGWVE